ncbi:MAG: DNA topoisomerase I [delta proteobacterium ML8_F1]|nr:MAG: DNA topoisomerase I [delta proteobacterium ML8_F1]
MPKYLVIVESPAKAKTIEKFLGRNFKVVASVGHIRDLPKSKMGIDVENDFEPKYINIRGKGPVIKEIKKLAAKHDHVLIATDPDREGEAIAWHLAHILGLNLEDSFRVTFNEITKEAVKKAVKNPRKVDLDLVDAQQARRILDRLVGYSISPILWSKVRKGLSAGRVQSVATKMICEREREILAFEPQEYWHLSAFLNTLKKETFEARVMEFEDKPLVVATAEEASEHTKALEKAAYAVKDVSVKEKSYKPNPSFITSSLQQEASNQFNFSTKKTMMVAQQLYEGIKLKEGLEGLITYMRTDSTRLSDEAKGALKEFILENFGDSYLGTFADTKNKSGAQDAHEAIRPSNIHRTPESIKAYLSKDQYRLYEMIWQRTVASVMAPAVYSHLSVAIKAEAYELKATGSTLKFDGYLKVLSTRKKDTFLPLVEAGEKLLPEDIKAQQKFTQPPARYSEASLVKEMEDKGIGRPSTYAPTISTIQSRGYVQKTGKQLAPTELGFIIDEIMDEHFNPIVAIDFTAEMEKHFDKVEQGSESWKKIIREFYNPFETLIEKAKRDLEKMDLAEETDIDCEKCGAKMVIKHGRYGKFLACSNYPECTNTKPILKEIGVKCPVCKTGEIVERRTNKFKIFYGCSNFPDCRFVSWDRPVNKSCPTCGSILVQGKGKNKDYLVCSNKECDYKERKV